MKPKLIALSICSAFVGHGRRVQGVRDNAEHTRFEEQRQITMSVRAISNSLSQDVSHSESSRVVVNGPSLTLALLLLVGRPTAAFHSFHAGTRPRINRFPLADWGPLRLECHRSLSPVLCEVSRKNAPRLKWLFANRKTGIERTKHGTREEWMTLLRLSAPDWPRITLALATLLVAATCRSFLPALESTALNAAFGLDTGTTSLRIALLRLVIVGSIGCVFAAFRGRMFNICSARILNRIRATVHFALLRQPQAFHDEQGPGALSSRLASDCVSLGGVLTTSLSTLLRSLVEAIIMIVIVLRINARIFILIAVVGVLRTITTLHFSAIFRETRKEEQNVLAASSTVAEEGFSLIRFVKTHRSEADESVRYGKQLSQIYVLRKRVANLYGASILVGDSLNRVMYTGILWMGAILLGTGTLTTEGLSSFVFYADSLSRCWTTLAFQWGSIEQAFGSASTVFGYLKPRNLDGTTNASITITPLPKASPQSLPTQKLAQISDNEDVVAATKRRVLSMDGVDFAYPSRNQSLVLKNLSLSVKAGERVALVGNSGCGKSTFFQLVLGLYQPTGGNITLDGLPLDQIDKAALYSSIAWVQQEPPLFPNMTIRENIGYGLHDVPHNKIEAAAKEVNAYGFIQELPEGFDTSVRAAGTSLSGGQKQRIALARALVRDPALLLLDEPTSALDPESARAVEESLLRKSKQRTVIFTTHKLAQAQNADRIIVMSDGKIVEEGSYDELLQFNGKFASLSRFGDY